MYALAHLKISFNLSQSFPNRSPHRRSHDGTLLATSLHACLLHHSSLCSVPVDIISLLCSQFSKACFSATTTLISSLDPLFAPLPPLPTNTPYATTIGMYSFFISLNILSLILYMHSRLHLSALHIFTQILLVCMCQLFLT